MLIKLIKELVEKIKAKQYRETCKGKMFRKYCLNIFDDKPQSTIEAYEDILEKIMTRCGYKNKKQAAIAYLYSVRYVK